MPCPDDFGVAPKQPAEKARYKNETVLHCLDLPEVLMDYLMTNKCCFMFGRIKINLIWGNYSAPLFEKGGLGGNGTKLSWHQRC
jgi:hypothetical protein